MRYFLCSIIIFWSSFGLRAQAIDLGEVHYTIENGLPHNSVFGTIITKDRAMWISTNMGLARMNNGEFQRFSNNIYSQPTEVINIAGVGELKEVSDNRLIIFPQAHYDSVEVFNYLNFESFGVNLNAVEEIKGRVHKLSSAWYGKSFFVSSNDKDRIWLYEFVGEDSIQYVTEWVAESNCNDGFHNVAIQSNRLAVFNDCNKEITILEMQDGSLCHFESPFFNSKLRNTRQIFEFINQDQLLISNNYSDDLYLLDIETSQWKKIEVCGKSSEWNAIWRDGFEGFYLGNNKAKYELGSLCWTDNMFELDRDGSNILDIENKRVNIFLDSLSSILAMSTAGGLYLRPYKRQNNRLKSYLNQNIKTGKFGNIIKGMCAMENGEIYINTESSDLFRIQNNGEIDTIDMSYVRSQLNDPSCANTLNCIDQYLWSINCDKYKDGFLKRYYPKNDNWDIFPIPIKGVQPMAVIQYDNRRLFMACFDINTRLPVFYWFDIEKLEYERIEITSKKILQRNQNTTALLKGSDGLMWIGMNTGLAKYNPIENNMNFFRLGAEEKPIYISSIVEDKGNLLVGTYGNGIFSFAKEYLKFEAWLIGKEKDQEGNSFLSNLGVASILPIPQRNAYLIGTDNGLNLIDSDLSIFEHYHQSDGFVNYEYNRFASMLSQSGQYIFGGINGVNMFQLDDLSFSYKIGKPLITRRFEYNKGDLKEISFYSKLGDNEKWIIPPDNIYFGLEIQVPDYLHGDRKISLYLDGKDENYSMPIRTNSIRFDNLQEGDYVLHIIGFDSKGRSGKKILKVPITVNQYFYKQLWFLLLGSLILIIGAVAYTRYYITKKQKLILIKNQEKAKHEKELLKFELQALRSQFNPHFIFNSMSAIQNYIIQNNSKIASKYLSDFSILMRKFLESSKANSINLNEEIELLKLYIKMENLRFYNSIKLDLYLDEKIDVDYTNIPSSLLQPYVENAINHGLFQSKLNEKLLIIRFESINESTIKILIIDNGPGRKIVSKIQQQSIKKHKSRGMQITSNRIDAINKNGTFQINLEISDYQPYSPQVGTKVCLLIKEVFD